MQCISSPPSIPNYSFIHKWNAQKSAAILIQTHFRRQKRSFFCSTETVRCTDISFGEFWFELTKMGKDCCINKSLDFSHSLCILVCVMYKLISFRLTAVSYCEDL
uniref:Uncharacterized protein n=1 Tax=Echinococcus canadensis TaxID=519352 RepID=A0A915EU55_9CEST